MNTVLGVKKIQSERFLEDGTRISVTVVDVANNSVLCIKLADKNGYTAMQLGIGNRKHPSKALLGHIKGANLTSAPYFIREERVDASDAANLPTMGTVLVISDILKPGDLVEVEGVSKGKGFAGVVKRHHFRGGPRTHGQSDRERAPGSIGQTTTPGRVYRGKKMAGRMGKTQVTVKNLTVVDVSESTILIKGLIPGAINGYVIIRKIGENKKHVPLYQGVSKDTEVSKVSKGEPEEAKVEVQEEVKIEEVKVADAKSSGEPEEKKDAS